MRKNKRNKGYCFLCFVLCLFLYGCNGPDKNTEEQSESTDSPQSSGQENDVSQFAFQIVDDMKIGWNLGNTLDAVDYKKTGINSVLEKTTPEVYYETLWGNPVTSKKMIDKVAEAGFGAVRVPVSFYDHLDNNYQISEEWLDRVEEVVQYVLENELYCIINLHHEGVWLTADDKTLDAKKERLVTVWEQIAERFEAYDEHLLFEGFNEIIDQEKNWSNADISSYEAVNQLNQTFVDTVRKSSGHNSERYLIVNTYAASTDQDILDSFQLPKDTIDYHLIAQVHSYIPMEFTWSEAEVTWTDVRYNWDEVKDTMAIDKLLESINSRFVSQGIPVILGEFGAWDKENTIERVKYAQYVVSAAKKYGITCFWWDMGGIFQAEKDISGSVLLNRSDLSWYFPEIVKALVESAEIK